MKIEKFPPTRKLLNANVAPAKKAVKTSLYGAEWDYLPIQLTALMIPL
jgi:hypothetical protein